MKTGLIIVLIVIGLCAVPALLRAQGSTATRIVPGFLSTTTTGSAACRPGQAPCFVPYSTANPLPTTTSQ